ncbi:hypothetical protein CC2G_004427 [Coprinopsis cinerea AmutBmut pab1-1]|nr:hypothetical protein CC2G_004427 [Coprinopsis cinerea AmutBmut pab1-1]
MAFEVYRRPSQGLRAKGGQGVGHNNVNAFNILWSGLSGPHVPALIPTIRNLAVETSLAQVVDREAQ